MSNTNSLSNIEKWKMKKSLGRNTYSNVADTLDDEELPLPPPPPLESMNYSAESHIPFPDPPFELLFQNNNDAYAFNRMVNDTKKTFPQQTPHAPSLRHLNNAGKPGYAAHGISRQNTRSKEAEVDHLTDLLVLGLDSSSDPEFVGMCYACGKKISGYGNSCNFQEKIYHIQCLTCVICRKQLSGTSFYAVEGRPHCQNDYLNSLENCCVCHKPIMDRMLKATGKPYHPDCFRCIICGNSLDGIPFTVDSTNQVYCIEDFHKRFAPRCCVCMLPIIPTGGQVEAVRIVALDKSFHVGCYRCEDCDMLLNSETGGCYPLDGHVLCRLCNGNRVQQICLAP